MRTHSDESDLATELRALRPAPRPEFARELDDRVQAGFPRRAPAGGSALGRLAAWLRSLSPRRLALPAGAVALSALVVATAVIAIGEGGGSDSPSGGGDLLSLSTEKDRAGGGRSTQYSDAPSTLSGGHPRATSRSASGAGEASADVGVPIGPSAGYQLGAAPPPRASAGHRAVERDAELVLRSEPSEIGEAANEVFTVVHAAKGIVLNSSIHDWTGSAGNRAAEARAGFELLIPTARLSETLASLSRIADVRSRHESTLDITAPTVGVSERLHDSVARIDGLLAQLASAEDDEERAAVETELSRERRQAATLRAQLDRLRQRADFARVSLRIESGQASTDEGSGTWGVDDALGDAGHILTIAGGVALIGVAVLAPLALIVLLAWLTRRLWVRRGRERALANAG
jgi:hypothetical protein